MRNGVDIMPKQDTFKKALALREQILECPTQYKPTLMSIGLHFLQNIPEVDAREDETMQVLMKELGFKVAVLNVGDYHYKDIVGIERKSDDLMSSVYTGKLFQQLAELQQTYDNCYLVIDRTFESVLDELMGKYDNPEHAYNTAYGLVAACCKRGFVPLFMGSKPDTAKIIFHLFSKEYDGKDRSVQVFKRKVTHNEVMVSRLAQLPGLSVKRAVQLCSAIPNETDIKYLFYHLIGDEDLAHDIGLNMGTIEKCISYFEESDT